MKKILHLVEIETYVKTVLVENLVYEHRSKDGKIYREVIKHERDLGSERSLCQSFKYPNENENKHRRSIET